MSGTMLGVQEYFSQRNLTAEANIPEVSSGLTE